MHNPLGEEIAEGTLGGLLAGGGMLASDQSIEPNGSSNSSCNCWWYWNGYVGRRIGAGIGKRANPGALKQQDSLLANLDEWQVQRQLLQGLEIKV